MFNGKHIFFISGGGFAAGNKALWFNYMASEKNKEQRLIVFEEIENKIYQIRDLKVMLDTDLAEIYGVEARVLNQAVKRNISRFPSDFMFQLSADEFEELRSSSQFVMSSRKYRGKTYRPFAFTEHGAVMLATILNSPMAVAASIQVVRAFVRLRTILLEHKDLAQKIEQLEEKFGEHDKKFDAVFAALRQLLAPAAQNKRQIGFTAKENKPKRQAKK